MTAPAPRQSVPCISCGNRTAMSLHNQPVCGTCQREGVNSESAQAHKAQHASQSAPSASLDSLEKYGTTVDDCRCPNHYFESFHNPTHVCKHMYLKRTIVAAEKSLAAAFRCRHCGVDAAAPGRAFCSPCAFVLLQFAAQGATVQTWDSRAHCCRCGAEYGYSDEHALYGPCCESTASVAA